LTATDTVFSITLGERVRLSAGSEQAIVAYSWSPEALVSCVDCPDPFVSPDSSATFVLKAYNAAGCIATKTVRVLVEPVRYVYAPTAFSPNGDGVNEEFSLLLGRGVQQVLSFQVYDRQGGMVFSAVDAAPGSPSLSWDGRLGQAALPARTYVWTAMLRFTDGTTERLSGEVVLIR
jgi:gliding motility-associated-like protein